MTAKSALPEIEVDSRIHLLAERHRKVLRLYGQRLRLKEIARELALSEHSVNTYLTEAAQLLSVGGRRAAAEALARHEGTSRLSRYQLSAPDISVDEAHPDIAEPVGDVCKDERDFLPLRPKSGSSNRLPAHLRLLWMLAMLIVLVVGIAVAVAVYTVYVKPMEQLLR